MVIDFVYPNNDEKSFIEIAQYLGTDEIYFVYKNESSKKYFDSIVSQNKTKDIKLHFCVESGKKSLVIYNGNDIRKAIMNPNVDLILGQENSERKDFYHHRNSGLNHVLCNLAKEKKKTIAFSFSELLNCDLNKRSVLLGRMKQNIMLCKKSKTDFVIGSFAKNPMEMRRPSDIGQLF